MAEVLGPNSGYPHFAYQPTSQLGKEGHCTLVYGNSENRRERANLTLACCLQNCPEVNHTSKFKKSGSDTFEISVVRGFSKCHELCV